MESNTELLVVSIFLTIKMNSEQWITLKALGEHRSSHSDPDLFLDAADARVEYGALKSWLLYWAQSQAIISFEKPSRSSCRHNDSIQGKLVIKEGPVDESCVLSFLSSLEPSSYPDKCITKIGLNILTEWNMIPRFIIHHICRIEIFVACGWLIA